MTRCDFCKWQDKCDLACGDPQGFSYEPIERDDDEKPLPEIKGGVWYAGIDRDEALARLKPEQLAEQCERTP